MTPTWSVLFDSEYADLQVLMSWQLADVLLMPWKCYSAYILVQFIYVHVCSCYTCTALLNLNWRISGKQICCTFKYCKRNVWNFLSSLYLTTTNVNKFKGQNFVLQKNISHTTDKFLQFFSHNFIYFHKGTKSNLFKLTICRYKNIAWKYYIVRYTLRVECIHMCN